MSMKAKSLVKFFLLVCACLTARMFGKKKQADEMLNELYIIRHQMNEFSKNEAGTMGVMDAVLVVVTGAVVMGVGAMILAKIQPNVVGSDEVSNGKISSIFGTAWDAFGLLPVALIVVAAVVIIGTVMLLSRAA